MGPPSRATSSGDEYEDDEDTYREKNIEDEEKEARRKEQISKDEQ